MNTPVIEFNRLKKNLKKDLSSQKEVRIALLADTASQMLTQAIKGYGIEQHVHYNIFEADYNQIERQVFDPASELYAFAPQFVFIFRSSEKLVKEFYKKDVPAKEAFASHIAAHTAQLYETITERTGAKVIFSNYTEINDGVFGNYASKVKSSFVYQVKKLNLLLMDLSQSYKNFFLNDIASLIQQTGYHFSFDVKPYINAEMVYSIDFLPYVAKNTYDIIAAISGSFKKCVILDLDNTTWGGIIGDDGLEGIQVGSLGLGKAFTELQLWVKELRKRGVIVAVCSKNTDEIAREPFIQHPEMVLRLDDIAVFVANWETKVDNIRHIQSILNIGFDAMVFLDDNPFEREMVKQGIPDITVPELPEDPSEYLLYLRQLNLFETASFTEEDGARTQQYQEEAMRTTLQKSFTSENDFLESLDMECEVKAFDAFTIPRIAQLSQRSNQFNLRTVRYTDAEVTATSANEAHHTLSFSLRDKYGDYGLIAYVILHEQEAGTLFIDSWVMSCRVLKRGMERFTLERILAIAKEKGFNRVTGEYIPTKKNGLVKEHYASLGFSDGGNNLWHIDTGSPLTEQPIFITVK